MDFRNPPAAQESSHNVEIICEGTVQYSFVSHLSAALRREGISSFVNTDLSVTSSLYGRRNQPICVVFGPVVKDYRGYKNIKVIKPPRDNGICANSYYNTSDSFNPYYPLWFSGRLEDVKRYKSRFPYIYDICRHIIMLQFATTNFEESK